MPWSSKQLKAIRAKKHGWDPEGDDEPFAKVSKGKLGKMEKEGEKEDSKEKKKKSKSYKGSFPFKRNQKTSLKSQMMALRGGK